MGDTIAIYDTTGSVISCVTGSAREPIGVPFQWITIPTGKYLVSMDVTVTPNVPIFGEAPKSAELTRLELLEVAFNELIFTL
jgi:hypothetical protein